MTPSRVSGPHLRSAATLRFILANAPWQAAIG